MSIDEAIKRLGKLRLPIKTEEDHKDHEAVRFGIEALKGIRNARALDPKLILAPLSGETRESETKSSS